MCDCYLPAVIILACNFHIIIDRSIGAPGQVKNAAYGLNSLDNIFFMSIIMNIYVG